MCHECRQIFRKNELIDYASPGTKTINSYCPKCLEEKRKRDYFAESVCQIFGIKAPGPILWTQRKRLINTYGYTDDVIIDCLKYLYDIKNMKKLSETLVLVTPKSVNEMMNYKKEKSGQFIRAMQMQSKKYVVPIKEEKENKIEENLDPDDWLDI